MQDLTPIFYDVPADASGTIVPGGASVTTATSVPGQNARLTFAGTDGQAITLQVSGLTVPLAKVSLAKPDGTFLIVPTYVTSSGRTFTASLPVGGTYTILVDPDGAYVGSATVKLT